VYVNKNLSLTRHSTHLSTETFPHGTKLSDDNTAFTKRTAALFGELYSTKPLCPRDESHTHTHNTREGADRRYNIGSDARALTVIYITHCRSLSNTLSASQQPAGVTRQRSRPAELRATETSIYGLRSTQIGSGGPAVLHWNSECTTTPDK